MNSLRGEKVLEIVPIYGGQSIDMQLSRLNRGVDIVVGTPGRVLDMIHRGCLILDKVSFAVLDEADEMLNMGFIEDIEEILSKTGPDKRMLMFSATMPHQIIAIAEKFMREYEVVTVKRQQLTTALTDQIYFEVRREDKLEALTRIIDIEDDFYALVFCRTKNDVDEITEKLTYRGYGVEALHGDISQAQRIKVIERFKRKKFNILIATDVAARGIDINNLTHVINFSIPQEPESYIHRIGRTGRAGKTGTAITFVTPSEYRKLTFIQKLTNTEIRRERLPTPKDIIANKKVKFKEAITNLMVTEKHLDYMSLAADLLKDGEPEAVLAAMLKFTFKEDLMAVNYSDLGNNSGGGSVIGGGSSSGGGSRNAVDVKGKTRLFVARGKQDGYNPRKIADMIWDAAKVKGYKVENIQCFDSFTFVTVPFSEAEIIMEAFRRRANGRQSLVELAKEDKPVAKASGKAAPAPVSAPAAEPAKKKKKKAKFQEIS
jgi:ATP-dependent RNA helicase DeaD